MQSSTRPMACQILLYATPCPPPHILLPPGNLAPSECWACAPPCPVKWLRYVYVTMACAVSEVQALFACTLHLSRMPNKGVELCHSVQTHSQLRGGSWRRASREPGFTCSCSRSPQ